MEEGRSTSLRLGNQSNKLIPRDISESLGKIPPSATELETAILGAVMLDKTALSKIPTLQPSHFYDDRHKEVFNAIKQLESQNSPTDFRMVVNQLRSTGKLELVGGAPAVVELTSGVMSGENVVAHARIVIELAMKRYLIQQASEIHDKAYDGVTDVFDLIDRQLESLTFLRDRETKNDGPERIKALWEKYQIKVKPDRPPTLIKIGEADVCTVGNLSLLVGHKKSRKSLLATQLLVDFLRDKENVPDDLLMFDTEQEEYDVWQVRDRIFRMTNINVAIFSLRGLGPKERREFISQTLIHWHRPVKIMLIDGIRDCMSNINDPDETTTVMTWLMQMNVNHKVHIMNILHLNKTDGNARGHIGSELLNKAEITIEVRYDEQTGHSVVKCESSRRKPFDQFVITHGPSGLPELLGVPVKEKADDSEKIKRLIDVFEGETLKYKEFNEQVMAHFQVGANKSKQIIAEAVRRGWVLKSGKDRSANTTYKLVAQPVISVPHEQPVQTDLFDPPPPNLEAPPDVDSLPF